MHFVMVVMPSRLGRPFTCGAAMLVALCVALAAASATLAAGDGATSTRLADACGKLTEPRATALAADECKSFKIYTTNAFTCDYITRDQSRAAIGDSLATVFASLATGYPRGAHEAVHTACALLAGKKSLKAACEASRDALDVSSAAFNELCKASFTKLPSAPPPPPSPPPPPPGPCDRDWVYKNFCLDLFQKGTSVFLSKPDDYTRQGEVTISGGRTVPITIHVRPDAVTKDCCDIISRGCFCDLKNEIIASVEKNVQIKNFKCFKSLDHCNKP